VCKFCHGEESHVFELEFGFTCLISNGSENSQFVLCNVVLSAESVKLSKLHTINGPSIPNTSKKFEFFRYYEEGMKR